MSCIINNGYSLPCNSIGGIEEVYLGTWDSNTEWTLGTQSDVTGVTASPTVYKFDQDIEHAGLEQTGQFSRENGTVFFESVLSTKFIELNNDLRNTIVALAKAPLMAIVKSNAGHYYLLGLESSGRASEGSLSLGLALGDMNGANLSFTWKSQDGAYLIDGSLLGTDIPIG